MEENENFRNNNLNLLTEFEGTVDRRAKKWDNSISGILSKKWTFEEKAKEWWFLEGNVQVWISA